jgi:hypothetical protein
MSAQREEFILKTDAQTFADKTHAWLIANNPAYARSVAIGQTLRWAFPYQDATPTVWGVNVKDRCMGSLTVPEVSALKPVPTVAI